MRRSSCSVRHNWLRNSNSSSSNNQCAFFLKRVAIPNFNQVAPTVLVTRRRVPLGELQSDPDEAGVLHDIHSKLSLFGSQLTQLESKVAVSTLCKPTSDLLVAERDH